VAAIQFLISVYGGFFGAGMGIMMMAGMGFMGIRDVHEMNRLKNVSAAIINGVAAVTFAMAGQVRWLLAIAMAAAAIGGGYFGARMAQRIGQAWVRRTVIAIGLTAAVWMFLHPL
jgi:uncharacterized membrane protein YfcA